MTGVRIGIKHLSILLLVLFIQKGSCVEVCGSSTYNPDVNICCNETIHRMVYALTCCCGDQIIDASTSICCEDGIRTRESGDEEECCQCPDNRLDVVMVLDNSEGLTTNELNSLTTFEKDLIASLDVNSGDVRVARVMFTHNVYLDFNLSRYSTIGDMIDFIDTPRPPRRGGTETGKALKLVREEVFQVSNGDRPGVPNVVLVITDGESNNGTDTRLEADLLKQTGAFVIAVGVGNNYNMTELDYISTGSGNVIAATFDNLQTFEDSIKYKFFSCKELASKPLCGSSPYDPATEVCCSGTANPVSGDTSDYNCCDTEAYNRETAICCNDKVHEVGDYVLDFACCGPRRVYDTTSQLCCNGKPVSVSGDPNDYACCGNRDANNVENELCCEGHVVPVSGSSQDYKCCGDDDSIEISTQICCLGNPVPIADGCCGDDEYFDPTTQICCAGVVQPIYGNDVILTACCNETSYDIRCQKCEGGQLMSAVNESTHICCQGNLFELIYDNNCCCGDELFDSTLKTCCNGQIIDRPVWDKTDCCECRGAKMDLAIVADHSESVERFHSKLIDFIKMTIESASVDDGDDRIALIMYTHLVHPVFDLNDYGTVDGMLSAIDNWDRKTGGSLTAQALNAAASIFTPANGDRPDAHNMLVLFSDGRAEDRAAAIAEATALKQIFAENLKTMEMVALGLQNVASNITITVVGIKRNTDYEELEAIASEPASQHVYMMKNFDALTHLHLPLKQVAGEECFDNPIKPPLPTCNGVPYSKKFYMCCDGVVQPRIGGRRAACCGDVSYDRKFFICCDEDTLAPAIAGRNTECCCRQSYDPATHLCCGNDIRRRSAGEYTECCGNKKYDSRKYTCCANEIQPTFGDEMTDCCNSTSYNSKCYECDASYDIVPLYDPSTQICCDGKKRPRKYGDQSCCCGEKQFNLLGQLCCEGDIRDVPETSTCACCGNRLYDVVTQLCCNGATRNKPYGNMTVCCGRKVMDPAYQLCCDDVIVDKITPKDSSCCGGVPYNPRKQMCCKGELNELPDDPDVDSRCCGRKIYDPAARSCCGSRTFRLSSGKMCCDNKEKYDPLTEICVDGEVYPVNTPSLSRCGTSSFDNSYEICCAGIVHPLLSPGYTKCCYDKSYDVRESTCCLGTLYDSRPETVFKCCSNKVFLPRRRICCSGRPVRKSLPSANECCGRRNSYDPRRQVCCNGRVWSRVSGLTTQCCGKKAFNPAWYICCNDNVLLPRRYGESTACCGRSVYHPKREYCCNGEVVPKSGAPVPKAG